MFGWKKDRDYQGKADPGVTPWDFGKDELPTRPIEPRVDIPVSGPPVAGPPVTGPRLVPGGMLRRFADAAGPPAVRRPDVQPVGDDGKRLIVGRDIVLTGEIKACDRLVIEGRVEAALSNIRAVEIAPSGRLKGAAQVDTADIAGSYEGDLTVQQKLHIRATGRVHGQIRYGSIEIERGGRIGGQVEALANETPALDAAEPPSTRARVGVDEMIEEETEDAE
jgi:cytoskeletal protein CcmA (bactofilin family)